MPLRLRVVIREGTTGDGGAGEGLGEAAAGDASGPGTGEAMSERVEDDGPGEAHDEGDVAGRAGSGETARGNAGAAGDAELDVPGCWAMGTSKGLSRAWDNTGDVHGSAERST